MISIKRFVDLIYRRWNHATEIIDNIGKLGPNFRLRDLRGLFLNCISGLIEQTTSGYLQRSLEMFKKIQKWTLSE